MIQETLKKVAAGQDLTYDEAYASMDEIFSGQVPGETTAGYLTALHMKGETLDVITLIKKELDRNSQCKWNERPCGVSST